MDFKYYYMVNNFIMIMARAKDTVGSESWYWRAWGVQKVTGKSLEKGISKLRNKRNRGKSEEKSPGVGEEREASHEEMRGNLWGWNKKREIGEAGRSEAMRILWAVLRIQGEEKAMEGFVFYHLYYIVNSLKHRVYIKLAQNRLATKKFHCKQ